MLNWNKRKYTKYDVIVAVEQCRSWREVAKFLGVRHINSGWAIQNVKISVQELNLSTEHFSNQSWSKGRKLKSSCKYNLNEILVENSTYTNTPVLRKRLISEGLLPEKCSAPYCPLPSKLKHPFTGEISSLKLTLDHMNGNNTDNRLENLRLLCIHCHSETETWCRGNKVRYIETLTESGKTIRTVEPKESSKCDCGNTKADKSTVCLKCEYKSRAGKLKPEQERIVWPTDEELICKLSISNYRQLGIELGVSDNAIRKRLKNRNLTII